MTDASKVEGEEMCSKLSLYRIFLDPVEWSCGNVQKWLLWTEHLYRLPQVGKAFQDLDGKDLCAMSEEDFRQRCPQCGDTLHAHLDIWKSGAYLYSHMHNMARIE